MGQPEASSEKPHHVGLAIRRRRRDLNMSQTILAREMGVSQEVISNYEIGQTPVRADDLPRFAEVLDVPLTYFYGPPISAAEAMDALHNKAAEALDALHNKQAAYRDHSGEGAAQDFAALEPEAQAVVMDMYRVLMAEFFSPKP